MIICNLEFEFSALNADDIDRMEAASKQQISRAKAEAKRLEQENASYSDILRSQCRVLMDYFDAVLGDGASQRLGLTGSDLGKCTQVATEFKAAIEAELAARGIDLPVYWGNRNWAPFLEEAVQDAASAGDTTLLGIATSAYSSYSSCRQYREDFARALEETGLLGTVTIDKVRQFFDHPGFVEHSKKFSARRPDKGSIKSGLGFTTGFANQKYRLHNFLTWLGRESLPAPVGF